MWSNKFSQVRRYIFKCAVRILSYLQFTMTPELCKLVILILSFQQQMKEENRSIEEKIEMLIISLSNGR